MSRFQSVLGPLFWLSYNCRVRQNIDAVGCTGDLKKITAFLKLNAQQR